MQPNPAQGCVYAAAVDRLADNERAAALVARLTMP
jgi:hypothetical protein